MFVNVAHLQATFSTLKPITYMYVQYVSIAICSVHTYIQRQKGHT